MQKYKLLKNDLSTLQVSYFARLLPVVDAVFPKAGLTKETSLHGLCNILEMFSHEGKKQIKLVTAQSESRFTLAVGSGSFYAVAHDISGAGICWRLLTAFHPHGHQLAAQVPDASVSVALYTHLVR